MGIISKLLGRLDDSNSVMTNKGRMSDGTIQSMIKDPDYSIFYRNGRIEVEHHPERGIYRAWFNDLSTKMKNNVGRMKGYGACSRCGGTWNWKKGHTIWYKPQMGMFPFCEECYQELTPQERYEFFRKIWFNRHDLDEEIDWQRVRKEVGIQSSARRVKT